MRKDRSATNNLRIVQRKIVAMDRQTDGQTLRSTVDDCARPYLDDNGVFARGSYDYVKNQLQTDFVNKTALSQKIRIFESLPIEKPVFFS